MTSIHFIPLRCLLPRSAPPCCSWAHDVSSRLSRRALGRDLWAQNSWTQSTYWSLLGYLGEVDPVHILCSGRKLPPPHRLLPPLLIFYLTLHRSPGCHRNHCSHFFFLSASSFTRARTPYFLSVLYPCRTLSCSLHIFFSRTRSHTCTDAYHAFS